MKGRKPLFPKPLFDETMLSEAFEAQHINPKHLQRVYRHYIQHHVQDPTEIPDLPKEAARLISTEFKPLTSKVIKRSDASDGSTTKLLIELQDGMQVESVIMRYGHVELDTFPEDQKQMVNGKLVFRSNKRATLCVSSQVGCAMGCTFCGKWLCTFHE
jgi:adenine C2-methylase RlmN of 23S rRNA A2503 and tRNA A37